MRKIFFVALLLAFLAMPFASAMFESTTTNNAVQSYGYPEIQIKSWFGLGGTVESLNLNYHTPLCFRDCESQTTISLINEGQLIDNIRFIDDTGANVNIPYNLEYGYLEDYSYNVPNYSISCGDTTLENGSTQYECTQTQIGEHQETEHRIVWQQYNYESLPAGDYLLRIRAQKGIYDDVDWQVHSPLSGWITQLAWWNSAYTYKRVYTNNSTVPIPLNGTTAIDIDSNGNTEWIYGLNGNYVYYNNENITAIADNSTQGYEVQTKPVIQTVGTAPTKLAMYMPMDGIYAPNIIQDFGGYSINGTTRGDISLNTSGKIFNSIYTNGAGNVTIPNNRMFTPGIGENFSVSIWFNVDNGKCLAEFCNIVGVWNDVGVNQRSWELGDRLGQLSFWNSTTGANNQQTLTAFLATGTWNHLVLVKNTTGYFAWMNGTRVMTMGGNAAADTGLFASTAFMMLGNSSTNFRGFQGRLDDLQVWNRSLTEAEISALYNQGPTALGQQEQVFAVTLSTPANNTITKNSPTTFTCIENSSNPLINNTLNIWNSTGSLVLTNFSTISGSGNQTSYITTLPYNGNFTWNCQAFDGFPSNAWAINNFTFVWDNTAPTITLTSPANNSIIATPSAIPLNYSVADTSLNVNTCWYNFDSGSNITLASCGNTTINSIVGDHFLNLYANDTLNNVNQVSSNFSVVNLSISNISAQSVFEETIQTFNQTINVSNSVQIISNGLFYNGSLYTGIQNSTRFDFGKAIQIPKTTDLVNGTHKFYWSFNLTFNGNSQILNSTTYDQFVHGTQLVLCNSSFAVPFVNYTFKDEVTNTVINNGTIPSSTLSFWVSGTDGVLSRTTIFSNNTMNPSYAFCGSPGFASFITNQTVSYASTQGATYPQRTYISLNSTLTNSTTNTVLYLLSSTAGQYVTFQVINSALAPIQGVEVIAQTTIGGSTVTVGHGFTDASGGVTMWLNPLASHTMTFEKTGYTTVSSTITPSQTSYTITMSQIGANNNTDYGQGINYVISPVNTYLSNGTTYNFNLTLTSTANTVTAWGFNITNSTGALMSSNSSSANGGFLSSSLNTYSNQSFVMYGYWTVNGVNSTFVKPFVIQDLSGTGYSILNLLSDFNLYVANGSFFGLDSFGLSLIIFLIIFTSTGILSYKFGIYSPAAIAGMVFVETAFFDIGLGLITPPAFVGGLHQGFATVFMFLIMVALAIKEATGY